MTSLKMMEVMLAKKMPMSKLAEPLKIYPQVLENVRVTDKKAAQNDPAVQEAVKAVAEALGVFRAKREMDFVMMRSICLSSHMRIIR